MADDQSPRPRRLPLPPLRPKVHNWREKPADWEDRVNFWDSHPPPPLLPWPTDTPDRRVRPPDE